MEISIGGWLGALFGTLAAVAGYALIVPVVESRLRALDKSETPQEREAFEGKLSIMRRLVLGIDILVLAAIGYWIGHKLADL